MKPKISTVVLAIICFIFLAAGPAMAGTNEGDETFTVASVGDCIISNKISFFKQKSFLDLVDILRKADCTYGNCETTFFNPDNGFPAYKDFDPNVFCYPWGADEMKWLGIDIMSLANNHIMDFDYNGLFATIKHLDRVGIAYAGAGKDLEQASRAGYFETAKGPVALISCSSWLPEPNHQATRQHPYMKGKPGLNPINADFVLLLDNENFAKIKEIRDAAMKALKFPLPKEEKEVTTIKLEESIFKKAEGFGLELLPDKKDMERIYEDIKVARRNARLVIVSQHEHLGKWPEKAPSKFQEEFARACIDAGADMFIGTGSHEIWPIEIYKGKPIFYSIGNFMFQGPLRVIAPEAYMRLNLPPDTKDPTVYEEKFTKLYDMGEIKIPIFESMVPVVTFDKNNKLKEITLYPIDLREKADWHIKGTPHLADKKQAQEIIKRLAEMCKPYKTKVKFENGVGKIIF